MTFKVIDFSTFIQNGGSIMSIWGILAEVCHYLEQIFTDLEQAQSGTSGSNGAISPSVTNVAPSDGVLSQVENGVKMAEQTVSEVGKVLNPVEQAVQRLAHGL